jgi:hypothetical protein
MAHHSPEDTRRDLSVFQAATFSHVFTVVKGEADAPAPEDIAGGRFWFTIRRDLDGRAADDFVVRKTEADGVTVDDPGAGRARLDVSAAEMAMLTEPGYWYDLRYNRAGSEIVVVLQWGWLSVTPSVTKALPG